LHELEVRNGLRLKAFHEALALTKAKRGAISRELGAWEARLNRFVDRGAFARRFIDWGAAMQRACALSSEHTLKTGTRAYDILHVAFALQLGAKRFITCDQRQAVLAKSAGQKVSIS
jgi:predicted nucleic acid-binding protein